MASLGRIMVIDDEEFDRLIYDRVIKRSGLVEEVISLSDAEEALAYLRDATNPEVHIILLDVNMPGMSGIDFLDAAQDMLRAASIPVVIMLTTPLAPAMRTRAAQHDVIVDYFMKPFRADHLDRAQGILARRVAQSDTSDAA